MMKTRLREIASSSALRVWASACPPNAFVGVCRVDTQHATYLFRNGSCFAATGKGERAGGTSTELVGMKIGGWLLPAAAASAKGTAAGKKVEGAPPPPKVEVSRNWRPGARAVLTAKGTLFSGPRSALTSPVTSFTQYAYPTLSRPRPPTHEAATRTSLTRVHAASPA